MEMYNIMMAWQSHVYKTSRDVRVYNSLVNSDIAQCDVWEHNMK